MITRQQLIKFMEVAQAQRTRAYDKFVKDHGNITAAQVLQEELGTISAVINNLKAGGEIKLIADKNK